MTAVKVWNGSSWVDSSTPEKVWNGSSWVSLGPSGATDEVLTFPSAPSSTTGNDGTNYGMGTEFSVVAAKNCLGISWRVPDATLAAPGLGFQAMLFEQSTHNRIALKAWTSPTAGGYDRILFDTPVALSAGAFYLAAVYTRSYVFRGSPTFPITSPSGNIVGDGSLLVESVSSIPSTSAGWGAFSSWYYVSPIVEV